MQAIEIQGERLVWTDAPTPKIGAGEILIANRATAVNRADLIQRQGSYAPPEGASLILGLECAGIVKAVGYGVDRFHVGDEVCALLAGGGYASEVAVPAGQALSLPAGFDFNTAAAVPEVFATAWLNLFMEAGLKSGERVLIHAGGSGVGTAAVQLCREIDADCFVTLGNQTKLDQVLMLGASGGTVRHKGSFVDKVRQWSGPAGVDVILDPVGGAYLQDNMNVLAPDGRLVVIGLMGGATAELSLGAMMVKRQRIIGSTLRARSVAAKAAIMDELRRRVWPLLESGRIEPVIERIFPITEAYEAHQLLAKNNTLGKLILSIPPA